MIPKKEHWHVSGRSGFFRDQAGRATRARLGGMTRARARTLFRVIVRLFPATAKPESRCIGQSCPLFESGGQTRWRLASGRFLPPAAAPPIRHGGTVARNASARRLLICSRLTNGTREKRSPLRWSNPILPVLMNHDLTRRAQSYVTVYTVRQTSSPFERPNFVARD